MDNNEMSERVIRMEANVENMDSQIKSIEKRMDKIETKLSMMGWGIAASLSGIVLQLLMMIAKAK